MARATIPRKPGKPRRARPLNRLIKEEFFHESGARDSAGSRLFLKLFDIAAAILFFLFCGKHQLKAYVSGALATLRKFLLCLEAGPVRQAMLGVQNFIDP